MRKEYYKLLVEKNFIDTLEKIPELSFSLKIKLLESLLLKYEVRIINLALLDYDEKYIHQKRVDLIRLKNTLIYYCKKNQKEIQHEKISVYTNSF